MKNDQNKTLFKHTKWSAQCVRMKETNKIVYDHTWWISILGPVGGSEVEAGAKKDVKNYDETYKVKCAK